MPTRVVGFSLKTVDAASNVKILTQLLLVATLVAMLARRLRVPYTVTLVVVGLLLGLWHVLPPVRLSSEVILFVFLPPLLFEGTLAMDTRILLEKWREIAILALPGTLLSFAFVAVVTHYALAFPWVVALLLGAVVSPTDPVAVLAFFKECGINRRLSLIVEGESVFNDGIGVVLFAIVAHALRGEPVSLWMATGRFGYEVVGGLAVGLALAWLVNRLLKRMNDPLVEVMLSLTLAYGSWLVAGALHASGVMAVVAAGLALGNYGQVRYMSTRTRLTLRVFWEVMAFVANSLLFLLMGLAFNTARIPAYAVPIALVFVALTAFRMVLVYLTGPIVGLLGGKFPTSWQHVVGWSGLRGSIPIALVLGVTLPAGIGVSTEAFLSVVVGVVLVSLVLQGLTIGPLVRSLGFLEHGSADAQREARRGRRLELAHALARLEDAVLEGEVDPEALAGLDEELGRRLAAVRPAD